ncbi:MAG: baseplate assembly protein [Plesiomonas sp.]|uniref:baseplate assembly protein n=1 Tax=Plesiomonas sp. TaxID=2486279 RepID=UPI003F2D2568
MAVVDLSQLPIPNVVEIIDFEVLLDERKRTLILLYPANEQDAVRRTLQLESEPIVKLLQENAYREMLLRQRVNEAAQAVMVAYAIDSDLDQLAANNNVSRLEITPADNTAVPPIPAVMEDNSALRARVPAAFEGLSVAGPTAAYEFHALSADGRVADASAISPSPASVTVTVLARVGNGAADAQLLAIVDAALNDERVRPVADRVTVQSANIVQYKTIAALYVYPGPEAEPILAAAKERLQNYISAQRRLGRDIRLSALYAALHVEGVQRVALTEPTKDMVLDKTQAAYCTEWAVTLGGTDE